MFENENDLPNTYIKNTKIFSKKMKNSRGKKVVHGHVIDYFMHLCRFHQPEIFKDAL